MHQQVYSFSSTKDTCLIRDNDTIYKIRVSTEGAVDFSDKRQVLEMEEVIGAVIYSLQNSQPLVKIQTKHFLAVPSLKFWKTGQQLLFQQNGETLNAYEYAVTLKFVAHPDSESVGDLPSTSSGGLTRATNMQQEKDEAQNTQSKKQRTTQASKSGQNCAADFVSKHFYGEQASASTHNAPDNRSSSTDFASKSQAAPKRKEQESSRSENIQKSNEQERAVGQESNIRYSLRNRMSQKVSRSPEVSRPKKMRPRSPQKCLSEALLNVSLNNANKSPERRVMSEEENSPSKKKRMRRPLQFVETTTKPAKKKNTLPENVSERTHCTQSHKDQNTASLRPTTRRGEHLLSHNQPTHDRSRRIQSRGALHQTIARSNEVEERRLRILAIGSSERNANQGQTGSQIEGQTFQQKDRHVIEEGDLQEELKLQTLASGETQTEDAAQMTRERNSRKRRSGFMEIVSSVTETLLSPFKRSVQSPQAETQN